MWIVRANEEPTMPVEPRSLKELFLGALAIAPAQRAAWLQNACGVDAELHRHVEMMLAAHDESQSLIDRMAPPAGAPQGATGAMAAPADHHGAEPGEIEKAGTMVGSYKLLEEIGEGGMGTVWMAEQTEPIHRRVAVKVVKEGMDSKQVLARFEAERQALALMDHPNIARVLDAGKTCSGRPYFVMELVKGLPITRYCDEKRLAVRERLQLFADVCRAVQHAHQKGIIHRDIKPSNVLVAPYDGRPIVKVIDFGVAKATGQRLTERTLFTGFGAVVGTLEHMSPEQAELNNQDIDTRSDIYSLGVLLYELLTGSTPFSRKELERAGMLEVLRLIREQEPTRPSVKLSTADGLPTLAANRATEPKRLTALVRGELDWIVMKALEKDRNRRYETANGLARDVERYLADEPVEAAAPSAWYRLRKLVHRNKGPLCAGALVGLALVAGTVAATLGWIEARKQREAARENEAKARQAADSEKKAHDQARKRLEQIEKGNEILLAIFADLNIHSVREGNEPLEAVLARRLLRAGEQLEGEVVGNSLAVAALQNCLGTSLMTLGHPQEAVSLYDRARQTREAQLGADHPDTLVSMSNLATGYKAAGKLDLAVPLHEQTLKRRKARLGTDHPDTLNSMNNLASAYRVAGRVDEAVRLFEEVLNVRKARQGADHLDTLTSMNNLANAYRVAGRLDRALLLFEETLKLRKAKLGPDHPDTLMSMGQLAGGYVSTRRLDLALPLMEETLRLYRARLGPEHPATLTTTNNLAVAYQDAGRPEQALPLYEEVLKLSKAKHGVDHRNTLTSMVNLASCHQALGKRDQALLFLRPAAEALEKQRFQHEFAQRIILQLIDCHEKLNQLAEAEAWRRKWLAVVKERSGPHAEAYVRELAALAMMLLEQKKWADAEPLLREFLAIREKQQPGAWNTFNTRSMLGGALLGQKKYVEAEPLLVDGYTGMKKRSAQIPEAVRTTRLREALERLVALYEATPKKNETARWRKELNAIRAGRNESK
jgi:serine/threonine protein kinase